MLSERQRTEPSSVAEQHREMECHHFETNSVRWRSPATIARAFSGLRSPDGYPPSWKSSYYVRRIHEETHATLHCKFQAYLSFLQSTIIEEKEKRRLSRQEKRKSNFLLAATLTMTGPCGACCFNKPTECRINSGKKKLTCIFRQLRHVEMCPTVRVIFCSCVYG